MVRDQISVIEPKWQKYFMAAEGETNDHPVVWAAG